MKAIKKMVAVLLAMCLLIGMPMSISAADASATELRLVGAQPVLSAMHSADKTQLMYFNQAITWNDSATVRVVVADSNNDVVTYNGTYLYWKTSNDNETDKDGYRGYRSSISSSVTSAAGVTVDTWTEIIDLLANDAQLSGKGYRLQIRMYDKAGSAVGNGLIDTVYNQDSTLRLSANYMHVNPVSVGLTGDRDCAYIDLGTVAAGAAEITPMGVVTLDGVQMTDETNMVLTFSEAVSIDTARTDATIEVVGSGGTIFETAAVTLTEGNGKTVKAALSDSTWSEIKEIWSVNTTRTIRLMLTEKDLDEAKGEFAFGYTVDTVRGIESNKPLKSYGYTADGDGRMDYVTATVDGPQLRLVGAQPVLSAMQSVDKTQLMYFNQAINWNDSATVRVVVADSNNDVVTYNDTYLYWKTSNATETTKDGYRGYRSSISSSVTSAAGVTVDTWTEIIDLLANDAQLSGKGYRLQIRMYDKAGSAVGNGLIDTVYNQDSTLQLSSNYTHINPTSVGLTGDRDCAYMDLGTVAAGAAEITPMGVVTLDGVQMIDETNMAMTFSEVVSIDTARTEAKIEVVGHSGTIFETAAVTLTEGNGKTVKAALDGSTWTKLYGVWAVNTTRTIRLVLSEKDLNAAKGEFASGYTVDTVRGVETNKPLQSNLYAADAEQTERMDYVTATVEGPQERVLTQDETVGTLIVSAGTTLDLNGHTLTVTNIQSFGDIFDSTEGAGGIRLQGEANHVEMQQDNAALPLYDAAEDCYRFYTPEFEAKEIEQEGSNTVKYAIRLGLPSADAYALLDDEDNYKALFIQLTLTQVADGAEYETFGYTFRQDILEEYVEKSSNTAKKYGITLTVSGVDAVAEEGLSLSATACLSSMGVQRSSAY